MSSEDAEEVRRTVEVLDLDEVQHGIAAAESVEVMRLAFGESDSVECVSNKQRDVGWCAGYRFTSHSHLI